MNKIHLGVYGVCIKEGKLLVIKKARGPYIGKLDLPGGGLEFGETIQEGIVREFMEETGLEVEIGDFIGNAEYQTDYIGADGLEKTSHHVGIYYKVILIGGELKTGPDGEDSEGAVRLETSSIVFTNMSEISQKVIKQII